MHSGCMSYAGYRGDCPYPSSCCYGVYRLRKKDFRNWVLEVPSLIGKIGIAGYAPAGSRGSWWKWKKRRTATSFFCRTMELSRMGRIFTTPLLADGCGGKYGEDHIVCTVLGGAGILDCRRDCQRSPVTISRNAFEPVAPLCP